MAKKVGREKKYRKESERARERERGCLCVCLVMCIAMIVLIRSVPYLGGIHPDPDPKN